MKEDERQVIHILAAIAAIAAIEIFGINSAVYGTGVFLIAGMVALHLKFSGMGLFAVDSLLARFERAGVTPGYGAMTLVAGALAIMTLLANKEQVIASLIILGLGDAGSTIIGKRSRRKLPYSRVKTIGGSAAFVLFSLPAAFFAGLPALPVIALAAIAESLESKIDDNLVIALACVVGFAIVG